MRVQSLARRPLRHVSPAIGHVSNNGSGPAAVLADVKLAVSVGLQSAKTGLIALLGNGPAFVLAGALFFVVRHLRRFQPDFTAWFQNAVPTVVQYNASVDVGRRRAEEGARLETAARRIAHSACRRLSLSACNPS